MMYLDTQEPMTRLTTEQALTTMRSRGKTTLEEANIVFLDETYPAEYDPELYTVDDGGNEQFTETRTLLVPDPMDISEQKSITVTVSGWRIKRVLVPREASVLYPILIARLAVKKAEIEDSGITLSNGISLATEKNDRDRILSLHAAYADNPENPKLSSLKFKTAANTFVPFDKSLISPVFRIMTDRTLDIFAREAAIQEAMYAVSEPADILAAYFDNVDTGWPSSTIEVSL